MPSTEQHIILLLSTTIELSLVQPENILEYIQSMLAGRDIAVKLVHSLKAYSPIHVSPDGKLIVDNMRHWEKANFPIFVIPEDISIEVRRPQLLNNPFSMLVRPVGKFIDERLLQSEKAYPPIWVILSGSTRLFIRMQVANA
jgi:hypothetical protein